MSREVATTSSKNKEVVPTPPPEKVLSEENLTDIGAKNRPREKEKMVKGKKK